jgi:hypothetical protein
MFVTAPRKVQMMKAVKYVETSRTQKEEGGQEIRIKQNGRRQPA